ncbi:MAG TPA: hypothetical protein VHM19_16025, partial [Polyangiales bacterium]|nr:hypothetical protein [Polyangiales bacterium]
MSTAAATNTRRERVLLFLVTACVVAYPPLYAVLRSGARGFFSYVRGDAFLYLTIARNSHAGFFSFDGTYPTNGFHPLWQYYLAALIPFGAEPGSMAPVHVALFSSLACVALGAGLAAVAIQRITRSWMLGCLVMPGVYYMLPGSIFVSQPIWEMVSGMECGASTLFGGALLYLISLHQDTPHDELLARRGLGSPFMQLGLLLPFVVMTRLDDVFLLPALALAVWWSFGLQPVRERIAAILRLGVPSALVVVAYVTFNRSYAGTFLPISGAVKNGFPLVLNTYLIASALFAPLVDLKNHFAPHPTDPVLLYNTGHRIVQLLAPTVFACVYGLWTVRKRPRGFVDVVSLGLAG